MDSGLCVSSYRANEESGIFVPLDVVTCSVSRSISVAVSSFGVETTMSTSSPSSVMRPNVVPFTWEASSEFTPLTVRPSMYMRSRS